MCWQHGFFLINKLFLKYSVSIKERIKRPFNPHFYFHHSITYWFETLCTKNFRNRIRTRREIRSRSCFLNACNSVSALYETARIQKTSNLLESALSQTARIQLRLRISRRVRIRFRKFFVHIVSSQYVIEWWKEKWVLKSRVTLPLSFINCWGLHTGKKYLPAGWDRIL